MWLLPLLALTVQTAAAQPAYEVVPKLSTVAMRFFEEVIGPMAEKTVPFEARGRHLILEYSADQPFEFKVSFPLGRASPESLSIFQPLHTLWVQLKPAQHARIVIDLARSPAWSPWRERYLLHAVGPVGSTILIHEFEMQEVTFLGSLRAYIRQFFVDEPPLLSSINFLHGYRVAGMSVTVLFGFLFFAAVALTFFSQRRRKTVFLICLVTLLVYDARFSWDLLRVSVQDLRQWYGFDGLTTGGQQEYRQLGPLPAVVRILREEFQRSDTGMTVAICSDETDLLNKQLGYHLYPIPVGWVETVGAQATHLMIIATARGTIEGSLVSCGKEFQRRGRLLRAFPQGIRIIRLAET